MIPSDRMSQVDAPTITLRTFGTLDLAGLPDAESLLRQPKRAALLVYLAVAVPRGFHRRDRLLGLFWPEHSQEHGRAALRKALHTIRHVLGDDVIVSRGDEEVGVASARLTSDAVAFDEAVARDRFARALELYAGHFLDGFFADAPGFERWAEDERSRYRHDAARVAWSLAERFERDADLTTATRWARKVAWLAPADERVIRRVIQLLERAGDRAGAMQAYEEFARRLKSDLDVEPSRETRELVARIRSGS
jgi:DNA-binding SARP family transcriptional activator